MLTPIIIATFAVLSLARCESVELVFLRSAYRFGSTTERDFFFKGRVCGAPLQWFVNGDSYGGFGYSHMVQDAYTRDDTQGSQPGQNVRYMGMLLDKTRNEDGDVCFTSLLIVYKPQLEEVVCRGIKIIKRITEFNISLTNGNKETGNIKFDYIFSAEVRFTGMPKYMHVLLCKVQSGESLSVDVNGNHVRTFNALNRLGADRLEPHGTDVISDAFLLSNRPSPENSLTVITLVFVENMEEILSVSGQAIQSGESLSFNLPLDSSQTSTGLDHSTSDITAGDVSSNSGSTSTKSTTDTSDLDSSTASNENKGISSIIALTVAVPCGVLILIALIFIVGILCMIRRRSKPTSTHISKPIRIRTVEDKKSIETGKQDKVDYLNGVHGPGDMRQFEEESDRKSIEVFEQAGENNYLNSSGIAMIPPEAAQEHEYRCEVHEADDEVDGVGANHYPAEKGSGSDEVDGVDMHPVEEENESSPGLREMLGLRKRRK